MPKIFGKKDLLLAQYVGDASIGDHKCDLLLINMHTPGIKCHTTGKTFVLPWEEILELAEKHGVTSHEEA